MAFNREWEKANLANEIKYHEEQKNVLVTTTLKLDEVIYWEANIPEFCEYLTKTVMQHKEQIYTDPNENTLMLNYQWFSSQMALVNNDLKSPLKDKLLNCFHHLLINVI